MIVLGFEITVFFTKEEILTVFSTEEKALWFQ